MGEKNGIRSWLQFGEPHTWSHLLNPQDSSSAIPCLHPTCSTPRLKTTRWIRLWGVAQDLHVRVGEKWVMDSGRGKKEKDQRPRTGEICSLRLSFPSNLLLPSEASLLSTQGENSEYLILPNINDSFISSLVFQNFISALHSICTTLQLLVFANESRIPGAQVPCTAHF